MFDYFYNEVFRSVIIGFGTLFNGIEVRHKDGNDADFSTIQVPLAYGPTQKFLARMEQEANLNRPVQITLPRMSFEFTDLSYDPSRKVTQTQTIVTETSDGTTKKTYVPVPYNMTIQLSIMTKLNDDMLQIIEQILPYFQPSYSLPIKFLGNLNEVKYVPVNLDNIQMEDDYEGNFDDRKLTLFTLTFTAKAYIFGPVGTASPIKKAKVDYYTDVDLTATRQVSYQVTPKALTDQNQDGATELAADITAKALTIEVLDSTNIPLQSYIEIGNEVMYVKSKPDTNKLTVRRAQNGTTAAAATSGTPVDLINSADDDLLTSGDDFGFNELTSFYG